MAKVPFVVTPRSISVAVNGSTHIIETTHPGYAALKDHLKLASHDLSLVEDLVSVKKSIERKTSGKVHIVGDTVMFNGKPMHNALTNRMLEMVAQEFDVAHMSLFLENIMLNPSKTAVDELYLFLEACSLPITEDGHFLAYKKVRDDYLDYYTGTLDNSVGKIVEMVRNEVDDNRNNTCSAGLHFCSQSYLPHYRGNQGRVMLVKINPADVVSIPSDYANAKGRAWRYEVVGEIPESEAEQYFTAPVYVTSSYVSDTCGEYEDEFYDDYYSWAEQYDDDIEEEDDEDDFDVLEYDDADDDYDYDDDYDDEEDEGDDFMDDVLENFFREMFNTVIVDHTDDEIEEEDIEEEQDADEDTLTELAMQMQKMSDAINEQQAVLNRLINKR